MLTELLTKLTARKPSSETSASTAEKASLGDDLHQAVAYHMQDTDEVQQQLVTAVVALLVRVACADQKFQKEEEDKIRRELGRVEGLAAAGVDAVMNLVREAALKTSDLQIPLYTRTLRLKGTVELRLEVLELLVELAAADNEISLSETNMIRRLADAMGLSQDDYNAIQAKHRDKLSVLE